MRAEVAPPAPFSYLPAGVLTSVGEAAVHAALANLQVGRPARPAHAPCFCEPACALFRVALHALTDTACRPVRVWQRTFISSLAKDYARWATDARCEPVVH